MTGDQTGVIKHLTASTYIFCEFVEGWKLGLIEHPLRKRHMIVGGHVECDETQAEAAVREATEESGLRVRLLPGPSLMLPAGFSRSPVPQPWWIIEMTVPTDNHLREPHYHIDCQYVAIADSPVPISEPAHPFGWYSAHELDELLMYPDTVLTAKALFSRIAPICEGHVRCSPELVS